MTDADPPSPTPAAADSKGPKHLVLGVIVTFVAIIGSCAAYYLWPRGERLGAIDLRSDTPTLSIDVGAGDKLNFRIDTITVGTKSGYPDSSRSRSNKVHEELKASVLTITAVGNDGASKASTECGAYADKATTGSSDPDHVKSSGLPLDCVIDVPKAGVYTVTAKVAWVPKDVREAFLEVRREKAAK